MSLRPVQKITCAPPPSSTIRLKRRPRWAEIRNNDQTGGGLLAYSNSLVRVQGGSFGQLTSSRFGGGLQLNDTSHGIISGGTLQLLNVQGAAAGAED